MRRRRPEDVIQRSLFQHIRSRGVPGLVAIHVPMGGKRKPIEAAIMKGLGAAAGVPDVLLWHGGKAFAVELKSETGKPTPAQTDMLAKLDAAGVQTALCKGIDAAITTLEQWKLLRGQAT